MKHFLQLSTRSFSSYSIVKSLSFNFTSRTLTSVNNKTKRNFNFFSASNNNSNNNNNTFAALHSKRLTSTFASSTPRHSPSRSHSNYDSSSRFRNSSTPVTASLAGIAFFSSFSASDNNETRMSSSQLLSSEPNPFKGIELSDLEGNKVNLSEQWKDSRVVLILLRRFGCALCHQQAAGIVSLKEKLDALGVKIVLVGNGSKYFAEKFKKNVPGNGVDFPGQILLDPESQTYKARNLKRVGLLHFLGFSAIKAYRKAKAEHPAGDVEGDGLQTGGVYVLGPGEDSPIYYEFREGENDVGKLCDHAALLKACESA